jgi:Bacterial DNA-binding protein
VVGKAEHLPDKSNPRFVVTSYPVEGMAAAPLYEELYCARGVGVLTVKDKGGWQGRNPRTGEALVIDSHRVMRFKASELLLARLNRPAAARSG